MTDEQESYDELLARIQKEYDRIREEEEARAHIRLTQPIRTEIRKLNGEGEDT